MDQNPYDSIRQQVDFDAWRGRNRLNESLFIWQYTLREPDIPDIQIKRLEALEPPPAQDLPREGAARKAAPPPIPTILRTGWRRATHSTLVPAGASGSLLNMDVYECNSRQEAHELLVRLLGEFQLPLASLEQRSEFGDVTFATPNGEAVLFARANLVFLIRNAERLSVPVSETAARFDADLVRKPEEASAARGVGIQRFEAKAAEVKVGQPVDLELETARDPAGQAWYKIFAPSGEVRMDEGTLTYYPQTTGRQEISAYQMRGDRRPVRKTIRLLAR